MTYHSFILEVSPKNPVIPCSPLISTVLFYLRKSLSLKREVFSPLGWQVFFGLFFNLSFPFNVRQRENAAWVTSVREEGYGVRENNYINSSRYNPTIHIIPKAQ